MEAYFFLTHTKSFNTTVSTLTVKEIENDRCYVITPLLTGGFSLLRYDSSYDTYQVNLTRIKNKDMMKEILEVILDYILEDALDKRIKLTEENLRVCSDFIERSVKLVMLMIKRKGNMIP